jgi:hypothetical protein
VTDESLTADLLEKAGDLVGKLAATFGGERGVFASTAVKAITHAAAQALRFRGATTDEIVQSLRKVGKLQTPWADSKVTGKDPA